MMRVKGAASGLVRQLGFDETGAVSKQSHANLGRALTAAPGAVEWRLQPTPRETLPGFQSVGRALESLLGFHGAKAGELGRREAARLIADTVDKTQGLDRLIMLTALFEGGAGQPAAFDRDEMDERSWARFDGLRGELGDVEAARRPTLRALADAVFSAVAKERARAPQQGLEAELTTLATERLALHGGAATLAPSVAQYAMNVFEALRHARAGFRDVSNGEWKVIDWNAAPSSPDDAFKDSDVI